MTDDRYHVYRPLLDLIGFTEGTDKGDGYNETLAYGAYTGGDVELVTMTLDEIDRLQTAMLSHPKNKWNSSAIGRYQIVRTTLRAIRKKLGLSGSARFDEDMQDRCACYLLGSRGIDRHLAGKMTENALINNLAREWASLPTTEGDGYYGGQHAAVSPGRVRNALAEVRKRREAPPIDLPDETDVEAPTAPDKPPALATGAVILAVLAAVLGALVQSGAVTLEDLQSILNQLQTD